MTTVALWATRLNKAAELRDCKHTFILRLPRVDAEYRSSRDALIETAAPAEKEAEPLLVEQILATHAVICSADDMAGSVV